MPGPGPPGGPKPRPPPSPFPVGPGGPPPARPPAPRITTTLPAASSGGGASGGGGVTGGPPDSNPELLTRGTGPNPEWVMRDFTAGMHVNPARDAIAEQDCWWMENLQPLASGNLQPVASAAAQAPGIAGEGSMPSYVTEVVVGTTPYLFVAYSTSSGNAYIVNLQTGAATKIMTGLLNVSGQTYAVSYTNYPNSGFLVIDPNGYWDYNLTASNTLTSLSNGVAAAKNLLKNTVAGGTALKLVAPASGSGALVGSLYTVVSVTLNAAGANYVPGDVLSLTDNGPITNCQITVTGVSAGPPGPISTIQLTVGGSYPGPASGALVNTGPSGNTVTGGSGTGATFKPVIQATSFQITSPGSGYVTGQTFQDETAGNVTITQWQLTAGPTNGTAIATYAGRVWIGNGNVLSYTTINSYNNFSGSGGSSTFSDQYLLNGITCLYPANNYLYMFGSTSVDIISNVQVSTSTGLTSFSRVNALQGLGVTYLDVMTVLGFNRGIVFLDLTGLYALSGATPERLTDRIQGVVRNSDLSGNHVRPSCALADVNAELCLLLQLAVIPDNFAAATSNRSIIFVYSRHRWWCHSTSYGNNLTQGPISGTPNFAPNWGAYAIVNNGGSWQSLRLLQAGVGAWQLRTKLWDGAAAFREKQGINVGLACQWISPGPITNTGITFTVDTEFNSALLNRQTTTLPPIPSLLTGQGPSYNPGTSYYALDIYRGVGAAQNFGSQFIGLTFTGDGTQVSFIEGLALRGKQERNMLE